MNRREILLGVGAVAAASGVMRGQVAEAVHAAAGDFAGGSKVFAMEAVGATKNPNGSQRKNVLDGTLATGEVMSMHESWSPAGTTTLGHVIHHSELIVVIEGTLGFTHDGKMDTANAGDVIYVAYGTDHAVQNVGAGTARYIVLQMGGDTK